jgi:transcriptional regulator with XRE-family HTH domain
MSTYALAVGDLLRSWRHQRRWSQLELATAANISARHLSFVETGRSLPSREMILHLADQLQIPIRERNVLLVAGGYAPVFPERALEDPGPAIARDAIDAVLQGHKPFPAFAIDRHWNIVASNGALPVLYEGVSRELLIRPINVLRLSLHPNGLAPRIVNLAEWRSHLTHRLLQQINITADPALMSLHDELKAYSSGDTGHDESRDRIVVPFRIATRVGTVSLISTTMVFGTPVEVTLSELAIEVSLPADQATP